MNSFTCIFHTNIPNHRPIGIFIGLYYVTATNTCIYKTWGYMCTVIKYIGKST